MATFVLQIKKINIRFLSILDFIFELTIDLLKVSIHR